MLTFGPAAFVAAFAAGFLSFLSPCVLPLVPGYLSLVSGVGFDELGARPRRVVASTAAFVVGFGSMFVLYGAGAAWFGDVLLTNRRTLEVIAGILIVLGGLVYAGAPLPLTLLREKRLHVRRRDGVATPALLGMAFGVGWTPCVGPTLAAILALAASGGGAVQGAVLLGVYALGLGIPFLLFGLGFSRALGVFAFVRRHRRVVALTSGGLLIVFGVLLSVGLLSRLTTGLTRLGGIQI